jgi:hypothetical protein
MFRETGQTADLFDFLINDRNNGVIHDQPAFGAVVIDHIPQLYVLFAHVSLPEKLF